jgi:hypothetical protein
LGAEKGGWWGRGFGDMREIAVKLYNIYIYSLEVKYLPPPFPLPLSLKERASKP